MSTFDGLPAHVLLVHIIIVLVPLTSVLTIACALWPAARTRLAWLVAGLAAVTVIATPLTTEAGEWLEHRVGRSPALHAHTRLGDTMLYFAVPLLIVAVLLVIVHLRETRDRPLPSALVAGIAILTIAAGAAATVQVYRIGDSGARSVWGDKVTSAPVIGPHPARPELLDP
ncbi:small-conductance mechanosensitive channel [Nocardia transvalensis]|uniref:Small-conductance mechanosensitive channel n=1 Tax=Nocardia transvalensis TaxID=37333 RepID=A0A7W9UKW5_9NOCA|nr:DUF2231 domain-containing protein [Nocardia transvalensis]MBB5916742.1 small-conductance mechanosensitive channel [Nocardia transvalensis]